MLNLRTPQGQEYIFRNTAAATSPQPQAALNT
jgi:hypothetical protein